jgi:hypothetical protein
MIRPPSTRKLHGAKTNFSRRRKRVSNAILKKRTYFLLTPLFILVTLFLLGKSTFIGTREPTINPEEGIRLQAAFAEIREKVEREKVDYSDDWRVSDHMWKSLKCEEIFIRLYGQPQEHFCQY